MGRHYFVSFVSFIIFTKNETDAMRTITEKPSPEDQQVAGASLPRFKAAIEESYLDKIVIEIQGNGESITIPTKALELLSDILTEMAGGKAVSLVSSDAELSTQQAADLLGTSRPHLVKLLEVGNIPFRKVGTHRRVLLEDVLEYKSQLKKQRKDNLKFLAEEAQSLGLGY